MDVLKTIFKEKKYEAFVLVGDEFEDYILNASKYIIKDAKDTVLLNKHGLLILVTYITNLKLMVEDYHYRLSMNF